jgi:fructose-1,6-bisphosphatase/inositol monophosphatase family enzyme
LAYHQQLTVAMNAALAAGALLRREFHRVGGPRGSRQHALADEEAEALIAQTVEAAFPEYGFRGEELGLRMEPRDHARHCWLVDPNDGTSAFWAGYRGAAVSIALLRAGRPVLGVVHAYAAPDDAGDLIGWAEGASAVMRNGKPARRAWPDEMSAECTVLLPHPAGRRPELNLELVKPMRFRGMPSIAYRLALVACGEGDATLSVPTPNGWDYAAGHALLLGAGAGLYDGRGMPQVRSGYGECLRALSAHSGYLAGNISSRLAGVCARTWKGPLPAPALNPLQGCVSHAIT